MPSHSTHINTHAHTHPTTWMLNVSQLAGHQSEMWNQCKICSSHVWVIRIHTRTHIQRDLHRINIVGWNPCTCSVRLCMCGFVCNVYVYELLYDVIDCVRESIYILNFLLFVLFRVCFFLSVRKAFVRYSSHSLPICRSLSLFLIFGIDYSIQLKTKQNYVQFDKAISKERERGKNKSGTKSNGIQNDTSDRTLSKSKLAKWANRIGRYERWLGCVCCSYPYKGFFSSFSFSFYI